MFKSCSSEYFNCIINFCNNKIFKMSKVEDLFPLKGEVTQEIIDTAGKYSIIDCIGAKTLRIAVESRINIELRGYDLTWGSHSGSIVHEHSLFNIGTLEDVNMMRITEPQTVTFILK